MIIDCVSDLHGYYPKLEGGDLLIVAGDLTMSDFPCQYFDLVDELAEEKYEEIIIIGGNHDNFLQEGCLAWREKLPWRIKYLRDSGTEFRGLKIWGSPWTKTFKGMNPKCKAFTVDTDEELAEKWDLIPDDTDILVTHSPMHGCLDELSDGTMVGSCSLRERTYNMKLKLHVNGHIHQAYKYHAHSELSMRYPMISVNASHVNEVYEPINDPIRVIL